MRSRFALLTLGLLAVSSCAKQTMPPANGREPASSQPSSTAKQDVKHTAAAANSAAVGVGNRVERGVSRVSRKLNEGADAIDAALKGK